MNDKRPLIILGAMDEEISAFLQEAHIENELKWMDFTFYSCQLAERNIVIAKCGVGKVLAAMVTQKMIDLYTPSAIIFTGIAGALSSQLDIGDILVAQDSIQHDIDAIFLNFKRGEIPYTPYRFIKCDQNLISAALSYKSDKHKVLKGRVLTGDQFIADKHSPEKHYLTEELMGDCVEMEGSSVGLVATINQIPHIIIRTISDKADIEAKINFREFLKEASENSLKIVRHIIEKIG